MNRGSGAWPKAFLVAVGAQGLVVQMALLRELMASFGGNEISAGLLLGTWVASEALGAWAVGRLQVTGCRSQVSRARTWLGVLAPVSAVAGVLAVPAVVLGRGMLGAMAGESVNVFGLAGVAAMVVFLPALTHGGLFVLGTIALAGEPRRTRREPRADEVRLQIADCRTQNDQAQKPSPDSRTPEQEPSEARRADEVRLQIAECRVQNEDSSGVGKGYVWEGAGTALAALLTWLLLLYRLPAVALVAAFGMPLVCLPAFWFRPAIPSADYSDFASSGPSRSGRSTEAVRARRARAGVAVAVVLLPALAATVIWAGSIERWVWQRLWPGQRVLEVVNSAYGKTVRMEREGQALVLYDGLAALSAPPADRVSTEEMAQLPLLFHPQPREVLLLGSNAEFVTDVLRQPVENVTLVILDRALVDAAVRADTTLRRAVIDPRFHLRIQDPAHFLSSGTDRFDCIILSDALPHSLSASRTFALEFYRLCRRRLKSAGLLAVPGPGSAGQVLPETWRILALRRQTLAAAFPHVAVVLADFPLFLASDQEPVLAPETLALRLRARGVESPVLDSSYLVRMLDPFRQQLFLRGLESGGTHGQDKVSTDMKPAELFRAMVAESRISTPWLSRIYEKVGNVRPAHLLVLAGLLLIVLVAGARAKGFRFSRPVAVATSGFAGMAITTLVIFLYQARFGSVYSGVGLLFACFMAGTVLGGMFGTRVAESGRGGWLFLSAELCLVLVPVLLVSLVRVGPRLGFFALLLLTGVALGIQFPIAGASAVRRARSAGRPSGVGRSSGLLLALDLAGGFLGALVTALFLVPVFGLGVACAAVVAVKLASAVSQSGSIHRFRR